MCAALLRRAGALRRHVNACIGLSSPGSSSSTAVYLRCSRDHLPMPRSVQTGCGRHTHAALRSDVVHSSESPVGHGGPQGVRTIRGMCGASDRPIKFANVTTVAQFQANLELMVFVNTSATVLVFFSPSITIWFDVHLVHDACADQQRSEY